MEDACTLMMPFLVIKYFELPLKFEEDGVVNNFANASNVEVSEGTSRHRVTAIRSYASHTSLRQYAPAINW